jgi:bifunctional DNA-binding transcriptional regulator/antitoxin component of YhaV-PrlF toxin-antitoxin module
LSELRTSRIVRPLRGGQITIPAEFRRALGIDKDTTLQMTLDGRELRLRAVELRDAGAGSPWLKELYDEFAPVRDDIVRKGLSEDQVNDEIDAALREVRGRHA